MNQIKEFLEYILNAIKFWLVVQPWEQALRVRAGKNVKVLQGGFHFKIPYIDTFYVQPIRIRVVAMPIQTVTSRDKQTVTVHGAFGYIITDISKLYNTLYQPEGTLGNIAQGEVADCIYKSDISEINPLNIENNVMIKLKEIDYGVKIEYFKLTGFAVVKTFRLIQDNTWVHQGESLDRPSI